jgi:hypothetical protein
MSSKKKIFSCPQCGTPYEVYPPDDLHPKASLKEPKGVSGTVREIIYDCENEKCRHPITVYWYRPKMYFGVG